MSEFSMEPVLKVIGHVESSLKDPALAPKQGNEGSPLASLVFDASIREALSDLVPGDEIIVVTWLDRARRDVLRVHPRGDESVAKRGVFSTRSPHRPNPIGLHRVTIVTVLDALRFEVSNLEAIHHTPIVDIKPVLPAACDA